jgi:hypothetical protein
MSEKLYAGADWLARQNRELEISKLGRDVADILGQVYYGLYHLNNTTLFNEKRTDWANDSTIIVVVPGRLQMTGIDTLITRCTERRVYVEIEGAAHNYMRLRFYRYCGEAT